MEIWCMVKVSRHGHHICCESGRYWEVMMFLEVLHKLYKPISQCPSKYARAQPSYMMRESKILEL